MKFTYNSSLTWEWSLAELMTAMIDLKLFLFKIYPSNTSKALDVFFLELWLLNY